jgi:predicted nucleotidyltransferase
MAVHTNVLKVKSIRVESHDVKSVKKNLFRTSSENQFQEVSYNVKKDGTDAFDNAVKGDLNETILYTFKRDCL